MSHHIKQHQHHRMNRLDTRRNPSNKHKHKTGRQRKANEPAESHRGCTASDRSPKRTCRTRRACMGLRKQSRPTPSPLGIARTTYDSPAATRTHARKHTRTQSAFSQRHGADSSETATATTTTTQSPAHSGEGGHRRQRHLVGAGAALIARAGAGVGDPPRSAPDARRRDGVGELSRGTAGARRRAGAGDEAAGARLRRRGANAAAVADGALRDLRGRGAEGARGTRAEDGGPRRTVLPDVARASVNRRLAVEPCIAAAQCSTASRSAAATPRHDGTTSQRRQQAPARGSARTSGAVVGDCA
jgi:hypothetical protein